MNLQLNVMPPLPPLQVPLAIVRWVDSPCAGLEFIGMSPADQAQLRLLVDYCDWMSPLQRRPRAVKDRLHLLANELERSVAMSEPHVMPA